MGKNMIWEIGETGKRIWLKPRLVKTSVSSILTSPTNLFKFRSESEVNYHEYCVNSIKMQ